NCVNGKDYRALNSSEEHIKLVENNLENLGELAVYDLVLGNFDRFHLESTGFNPGNIMFQEGVLCPIDTDCVMDLERDDFTMLALKKIVQGKGEYEDKIAFKLARNLGSGMEPKEDWSPKIKDGMKKAINRLI